MFDWKIFEWWASLPWWLRYGIAIFFLLISIILALVQVLPWNWAMGGCAIGFVLLVFSGKSDSEKKGYRF